MHSTIVEQLLSHLKSLGIKDERVFSAISQIPRDVFVDEAIAHQAWENTALPIGFGQTISQPYIVALMTQEILHSRPCSVLEVGTGSGYQTAVLSLLFDQVFSIERIKSLQYQARRRLQRLDLHNISMRHGDGWSGWSSKAPFDSIIVTAAAEQIPEALIHQLADGGKMVLPVGAQRQELILVEKYGNRIRKESLGSVRFVPLIPGEII